ncbi:MULTISPECIES: hypothetical protein [Microbacterium]|uniref:hypothetical protein n=1 Tax=Microbacterium TaxID=33882 RepID=UPI00278B39BE|nr:MULTISPECIES: hypothetical protein [Microbacterium]MDQ1083853.1 hypothetical protein [Microbacterium sp. SORGH_AS_0344]MDQ1170868.1 hypothetical protein [Microbacterium proteolyticum]
MKLNFAKVGASAALAGALLLAAPVVANAATPEYPPTGPGVQSRQISEDGPQGFGGYLPGSPVTFTLTGVGVTASNIASAGASVTSASVTKFADASGSAAAVITLPEPQIGSYVLTAAGTAADGTPSTSTSVVGGGAGTGGSSSTGGGTEASSSLAETGMDANSLLGFWIGGGALVLAGATVAVAATARRNRRSAD